MPTNSPAGPVPDYNSPNIGSESMAYTIGPSIH